MLKTCSKCKKEKHLDEFSLDKSSKSGRVARCKACVSLYFKGYYKTKKEEICGRTSDYQKSNPQCQTSAKRKWENNNKEKHLDARRRWHARKYRDDISYKLNFTIRGALRRTLNAAIRNNKDVIVNGVNYTPDMLRDRLEMNFKPGMSWDNYGEWHIDHRVPISRLLRRGVTDQSQINCLSNLVPLWAEENLRKGKR